MNRWTVHVKNFGKIEEASVEIAPLTLFVGDNNSGKSYMMTLIYGLLNVEFFYGEYQFDETSDAYQMCYEIIEKMITAEENKIYTLQGEKLRPFKVLLNEVLMKNKEKFLLRLFNKEMDLEEIEVLFPEEMSMRFSVSTRDESGMPNTMIVIREDFEDGTHIRGYGDERSELQKGKSSYTFFISYIMECMLREKVSAFGSRKCVYLPTARTGFMLTYKTLVGNAMKEKFSLEKSKKNLLTKPTSDFLGELSSMQTVEEEKRFEKVIQFIEDKLIAGHVNVSDAPTQDLLYTPEGSEQKLPLYVTSGVVTEMTPLLLFLKYVEIVTLLIEEPEISLHPQLQWQVARVLIRLSNMGLPVFVTTHSDLILQHVNNMIKANEMKDKEAFLKSSDYEEEDLLNRENIRVYQFDVQENHKTKIQKLPCGDYGFEAMTFYETLRKMNNEIDSIENEE